jgi:hypothetical protein
VKDLDFKQIVHMNECYPHVLFYAQPGKFKDISIVKDIFDHCRTGESIFEPFFFNQSFQNYCRKPKNVFANCWLDEQYLPDDIHFEQINSLEQVDTLRDGFVFLHDLEKLFNSRGSLNDKEMNTLIDMVDSFRKHKNMLRGSCHREMSVDVKIRSIITLWVEPDPQCIDDYRIMNNYIVPLNIYYPRSSKPDAVLPIDNLQAYANLYNTLSESYKLTNNYKDAPKGPRVAPGHLSTYKR